MAYLNQNSNHKSKNIVQTAQTVQVHQGLGAINLAADGLTNNSLINRSMARPIHVPDFA